MAHKGFLSASTTVGLAGMGLALFLMLTLAPLTLGPFGVTFWFLTLLAGLTGLFAAGAYLVAAKLQSNRAVKLRRVDAFRRGLFIGGYATILLALSSLQQLNPRDALLLLLLLSLTEFYMVART